MKKLAITACIALALVACGKKEAAAPEAAQQGTTSATQNSAVPQLPPGHPAIPQNAQAVTSSGAPVAGQAGTLTGKVLETMDAGGYTYVKLKTDKGDLWAAVNQSKVKVGQDLTIVPNMTMENFESKTLNRKFDKIIFGTTGVAAAPAAAANNAIGMMSKMAAAGQNPHAAVSKPAIDTANIKVDKATGADAKTVAEIWAGKAALKDKPVTVRGKVVKYLPAIMGKNWIHLRDGSGAEGTNDLTITTTDVATAGDIITVKGNVHTDVDFGAGYSYAVIIEDGKISK